MQKLLLKELLRFYRDHGTNMYVCFLHASKAFDRVDYTVLFRKLMTRDVPVHILRLLWNWYAHHFARILWAGVISDSFAICNGVRQGNILSPFYLESILMSCRHSCSPNTGCRMSNIIVNHLLFADDAVIFAPSSKGLQQLLDICSEFAATHNVVFNVKKSQCLIVASKNNVITRPNFQLCGAGLPYADSYKYLGHIISSDLSDNVDIMSQTRCLYARANTIIRKFNCASLNAKLMLFRAYCVPVYGCQL